MDLDEVVGEAAKGNRCGGVGGVSYLLLARQFV
jgi:hypothetical protein